MTTVEQKLTVGISELVVTDDPGVLLVAHGLGSCLAIAAFSKSPRVAGMVHVMLPTAPGAGPFGNPALYADTGIEALIEALRAKGAKLEDTVFKLTGGAAVLRSNGTGARLQVGDRNIEAAEAAFKRLGIRVRGRDVGGKRGRSVELDVATGRVVVRTFGDEYREL